MKNPKKAVLKQSMVLIGVAGGLLLLSACSSTKVLDSNGDIPAPSLTPPENANQVVTQELQAQPVVSTPEEPVIIQAATSVPGFKEGVEGKVKYTVKKGDSLWRVSKMFDVSVRELAAYNNMDVSKGLKVGTILQIPPSGLAAPKAVASVPAEKHKKHTPKASKKVSEPVLKGNGSSYIIKKGDSLGAIAKKCGVTARELIAANSGLTEKSKLKIGQKLNVPGKSGKVEKVAAAVEAKAIPPTETKDASKALSDLISSDAMDTSKRTDSNAGQPTATAVASPTTPTTPPTTVAEQKPVATATPSYLPHTVKDGDTWQTISDMYGLSLDDLKKANASVTGEPGVGTTVNIPEE